MEAYRRVTEFDRVMIYTLKNEEIAQSIIAERVGFNPSTISRELKRNRGEKNYRPKQAHTKAIERQEFRSNPRKMNTEIINRIELLIKESWSPEQISNRLALEGKKTLSHETIYQHVYNDKLKGGKLYTFLRQGHRKRKRRFPSQKRRSRLKDINPISERPVAANERTEIGHLERDLVIGKNHIHAVLTIVDRKTRYTVLAKLEGKDAEIVGQTTVEALVGLPKRSMTNDRGLEFATHKTTANALGCKVYFCDPYSSQQRGTNENTNGLLRQFLPKGTDFTKVNKEDLQRYENKLNCRPRKCLDWLTPYEAEWGINIALTN